MDIHGHAYMETHTWTHTPGHIYMDIYGHACPGHIYIDIHGHTYLGIYTRGHTWAQIHGHIYMDIHGHTYIDIWTHMDILICTL